MKILKEEGNPLAEALNAAEEILKKAEITIDFQGGYMFLYYKDKTFRFRDIESGENISSFPRSFSSEKLILDE